MLYTQRVGLGRYLCTKFIDPGLGITYSIFVGGPMIRRVVHRKSLRSRRSALRASDVAFPGFALAILVSNTRRGVIPVLPLSARLRLAVASVAFLAASWWP